VTCAKPDINAINVRPAAALAGADTMVNHHSPDRRVRRTHAQLHGALASLVHEKPYDDIVVKEILARADVGRSTFYAHYRDKDELLERGIRDLLGVDVPRPCANGTSTSDRLLAFSLPFLEHVERYRVCDELSFDAPRAAAVHEHLRLVLESVLGDQLVAEHRRPSSGPSAVPPSLLARHVAATFVLSLDWWLEHPALSAREVDGYFRELVAPVVRTAHDELRAAR
jgi:AcrR family transcriptional regulator